MLRPTGARLLAAAQIAANGQPSCLLVSDGGEFSALLAAAAADPALQGVPRAELALLLAVCLLTSGQISGGERLLHATVLAGLIGAVPGEVTPSLAVDCAIAYGCGWRRSGPPEEAPPALWENAVRLLGQQVQVAVKSANRRLAGRLKWLAEREPYGSMLSALQDDVFVSASVLAFRLIRPLSQPDQLPAELLEIRANAVGTDEEIAAAAPASDFAVVTGRLPLAAGARYLFEVSEGFVLAEAHGRILAAGAGGQIVVRAGDFGHHELWFPLAANLGRLHRLSRQDHVEVESAPAGTLLLWECGCGSFACAERHRLSSWVPDAQIGLKGFVYSAVNGRNSKLTTNSFTAGMYYSYLVREGWSAATAGPATAPQPRLRLVPMIRRTQRPSPDTRDVVSTEQVAENLLVISTEGDFRPVRVVRCRNCGVHRSASLAVCECGNAQPPGSATVVWKPTTPWAPGAEPDEDPGHGVFDRLEEFRAGWRQIIDEARERHQNDPDELTPLVEQQSAYLGLVEAIASSDYEAATDRINYARQRGWPLPELSRD